jgi:hypothetical protein
MTTEDELRPATVLSTRMPSVGRPESIAVADLAQARPYARLWRRLANTGVRAVLASPVRVWGNVIGNLNAVRHHAHRWTATEIRANEAYAKVIGSRWTWPPKRWTTAGPNQLPGRRPASPEPSDPSTDLRP